MKLKLFSSVAVIALMHTASVVDAQNQTASNIKLLGLSSQKQKQLQEIHLQKSKTTNLYGSAPAFQYDSVYYYELSGTAWLPNGRIINIVYDGNNNMTYEQEQRLISGVWTNSQTRTYTYNSNNNVTERTDQNWDGTDWVYSYRFLYTYDFNDKLTNFTGQQYSGYAWVNTETEDFTYDSNGNVHEAVFSLWHSTAYFLNSKKTYTYNSGNKIKTMTFYDYNYQLNDWQLYLKEVYHYEGGLNTKTITQILGGRASEKVKRTFDSNDNVVDENYFYKQDSTWVKGSHVAYDYNNAGILKKATYKNFLNGEVFNGFRARYFFHIVEGYGLTMKSNATASTVVADNTDVMMYPNPSDGIFKVGFENNQPIKRVEVYNALGIKVLEQTAPEIRMEGAAKGIYLVNIYNGEKMVQRKMIID